MSNHLAIATVTAAIEQLVIAAVASTSVGGAQIRFGRPPSTPEGSPPTVHIYLYGATPLAALRNEDLATRGPEGQLVRRPRAALALHYLLSFHGDLETMVPQRMLAAVARDLHARPGLGRALIGGAIAGKPFLTASDLAEADEPVRLNPQSLPAEDLSRLWSGVLQSPHILSLAYDAAPVLLDALESGPAALPALSRGEADRGPEAQASLFPRIESIWAGLPGTADLVPRPPGLPAAQLGAELVIAGANLGGEIIRFAFKHAELGEVVLEGAPMAPGLFRLLLPDDGPAQTDWAAGLYAVTAIVTNGGEDRRSAVTPMPLAPRIGAISPAALDHGGVPVDVVVTCRPKVLEAQPALAFLANVEAGAKPRADASAQLTFPIDPGAIEKDEDENPKAIPLFVRVDGIDSQPFVAKPGGGFAFDDQQKVEVTWP